MLFGHIRTFHPQLLEYSDSVAVMKRVLHAMPPLQTLADHFPGTSIQSICFPIRSKTATP